jgi:hypothetical protein
VYSTKPESHGSEFSRLSTIDVENFGYFGDGRGFCPGDELLSASDITSCLRYV